MGKEVKQNKTKRINYKKRLTQIMALILALLMVGSVLTYMIYTI